MIRAIVVDDEKLTREEISMMVQETGFIDVIKAYASPLEALAEVEKVKPQVAFIDIGMPQMDGLTLAERLVEKDPFVQVVFITAYNQYAIKAFELNALDYILKPVQPKRFAQTVDRVTKAVSEANSEAEGQLEIQCFGSLDVRIGGKRVKWGRIKAEELFCYLLANHGQGVHKEAILEVLWPDYSTDRALPILQTSICKLRNLFAPLKDKVEISYVTSRYCLNITDAQCDLFLVNDVLEGTGPQDMLDQAAEIVSKGFMPGQGYLWAVEKEEGIKGRICNLLKSAADACIAKGEWEQAIRLLRLYMEIIPFDEDVGNQLLLCYREVNDEAGLNQYFQWLKHTLGQLYDMEPSPSISKLYRKLMKDIGL